MLAPTGCFLCVKKQQYRGEIALVTNLRPLMYEQLLKFGSMLNYLNGEYRISLNNVLPYIMSSLE